MALEKNHLQKPLGLTHIPGYFLLFCVIISLYFLFKLYAPFGAALIFAAVLATVFFPLYRFLKKAFLGKGWIASLFTCFVVVLVIVIPFVILLALLANEAISAYEFINVKLRSGALDEYLVWQQGGFFYDLLSNFMNKLQLSEFDLKAQITSAAKNVSEFLVAQSTNLLTSIVTLFLDFLILIVTLYYFLKDGHRIIQKFIELSPLPTSYEKSILQKLGDMTNAVLYGTFLTAIVQGFLGGFGFYLAGIDQAFFWGTVMAFFSLLPYAGTAVIWFPAAILLFLTGSTGAAIFLLLWGMLAVSMSDNFLRPYFIGSKTETYPLLMFLAVFGGIFVYGLSGVLFGPLVVTFAITFLEIYQLEYHKVLKDLDHKV